MLQCERARVRVHSEPTCSGVFVPWPPPRAAFRCSDDKQKKCSNNQQQQRENDPPAHTADAAIAGVMAWDRLLASCLWISSAAALPAGLLVREEGTGR